MKQVYAKMRKNAVLATIGLGALLLIGGIGILWGNDAEVIRFLLARTDVQNVDAEKLDTDAFYRCDMRYLLDYYGTDDEGYYCIAPAYREDGQTSYMGFYVYNQYADQMEQIFDETYDSFENDTEPTTSLKGRGYVYDMDWTEREYFTEWMEEAGADEETIENLCFKTFVMMPVSEALTGNTVIGLLVGVLLLLAGLALILDFLTGFYRRKFRKAIQEGSVAEEDLTYDMSTAKQYRKADVGRKYMILYGSTPELIVFRDLIWAYAHLQSTTHKLYGIIPTGTTKSYSVRMVTRDGKNHILNVKNEEEGQEILKAIATADPGVIIGYSDDLEALKQQDFDRMVQLVDERKMEQA